jgi:hypothetical protein
MQGLLAPFEPFHWDHWGLGLQLPDYMRKNLPEKAPFEFITLTFVLSTFYWLLIQRIDALY